MRKVTFERRRYGRQFYCWGYLHNGAEVISLGDPWPATNWPKRELQSAVNWALAGKVETEAVYG